MLNVFGSTPLQMRLDPSFLSGDVDLFASEDLDGYVAAMRLGKGASLPYIEVVPSRIFVSAANWRDRAEEAVFGNGQNAPDYRAQLRKIAEESPEYGTNNNGAKAVAHP